MAIYSKTRGIIYSKLVLDKKLDIICGTFQLSTLFGLLKASNKNLLILMSNDKLIIVWLNILGFQSYSIVHYYGNGYFFL